MASDERRNFYSTLEVNQANDPCTNYPEVSAQQQVPPPYPDLISVKQDELAELGPEMVSKPPWYRQRKILLLVGLAVLLLVVAVVGGVVGGILGNKKPAAPDRSSSTETPTSTPVTATMSGTATATSGYHYPTPISWGYPHMEVYLASKSERSFDSAYWKHRGLNNTEIAWTPTTSSLDQVGGQLLCENIAAVARKPGDADIYITGDQNALYHKSHNRSAEWSPEGIDTWDLRAGSSLTVPTVVSWNANRIDIFIIGLDSGLYHQWWDAASGYSSEEGLRGNWSAFAPTVVSWGENRLDIFVVESTSKELFHLYWNGTWGPSTGFENLGGYCTSRPAAVSSASGKIDVVVRGGDAGLWHLSFDEKTNWSNWTRISGNASIQAEPEIVSWDSTRLDVFAWGDDQSLLHKSHETRKNEWTPNTGFEKLGGGLGGPPKAVSDAVGSLHVFSLSRFGSVQHTAWNETIGTWSPERQFENLGTPPIGT